MRASFVKAIPAFALTLLTVHPSSAQVFPSEGSLGDREMASASHAFSRIELVECLAIVERIYAGRRALQGVESGPRGRQSDVDLSLIARQAADLERRESSLVAQGFVFDNATIQAEMNRVFAHSRDPQLLGEIVAALGSDPERVARCLIKPELLRSSRLSVGELLGYKSTSNPAGSGFVLPKIEGASIAATGQDSWRLENVPDARREHSGVWTGSEMIVWGGRADRGYLDTGAAYTPATDSWEAIPTDGAPSARASHTGIWCGGKMVIWGGYRGEERPTDGATFDPATNSWSAIQPVGAPLGRESHSAVCANDEVIIWGGSDINGYVPGGARYSVSNNAWSPVSSAGAPPPRTRHSAVWIGDSMVVWGGDESGSGNVNSGARYFPGTDVWAPIASTGAPSARSSHTAVWTGTLMVVWGGRSGANALNTGGRYNPATNSWLSPQVSAGPSARFGHSAVWSGTEMVVWGGATGGARYFPTSNSWATLPTINGTDWRTGHSAVWAGTEMLVWGGSTRGGDDDVHHTGFRWSRPLDEWTQMSDVDGPTGRSGHSTIYTGVEMIVWGGVNSSGSQSLRSGMAYRPATDMWREVSMVGAPTARHGHTATWNGTEMLVWGGRDSNQNVLLNDGARYAPVSDSWLPISMLAAPQARYFHSAVWSPFGLLVWGGIGTAGAINSGAILSPSNIWSPISLTDAPHWRYNHSALWTGERLLIWGGTDGDSLLNTGGQYSPATNSWTATTLTGAPEPRSEHAFVWTGSEMLVWGGRGGPTGKLATGAGYTASDNTWTPLSSASAPPARRASTAIWTGSELIVWGGEGVTNYAIDGAPQVPHFPLPKRA